MSLIRWNPLTTSLGNWPSIWDEDDYSLMPAVSNNLEVFETDDQVVVKANVAGVPADRVEVMFEKGVLRIKADKDQEVEDKKRQHYSRSSWSYSYRVAVPAVSQLDHGSEPEAVVKDGVITVTFKKSEATKPKQLKVTQA